MARKNRKEHLVVALEHAQEKRTQSIVTVIRTLNAQRSTAAAELSAKRLELLKRPGDDNLLAECSALAAEVEAYAAKIGHYDTALAKARELDIEAAAAEEHAKRKAHADRYLQFMGEVPGAAVAIEETADVLVAQLVAMRARLCDAHAAKAAAGLTRKAEGNTEARFMHAIGAALAAKFAAAGFDESLIYLTAVPAVGKQPPLVESAQRVADRVVLFTEEA